MIALISTGGILDVSILCTYIREWGTLGPAGGGEGGLLPASVLPAW